MVQVILRPSSSLFSPSQEAHVSLQHAYGEAPHNSLQVSPTAIADEVK